jgi:hypothetical protein
MKFRKCLVNKRSVYVPEDFSDKLLIICHCVAERYESNLIANKQQADICFCVLDNKKMCFIIHETNVTLISFNIEDSDVYKGTLFTGTLKLENSSFVISDCLKFKGIPCFDNPKPIRKLLAVIFICCMYKRRTNKDAIFLNI